MKFILSCLVAIILIPLAYSCHGNSGEGTTTMDSTAVDSMVLQAQQTVAADSTSHLVDSTAKKIIDTVKISK
jgi:hypothetical protein